LIFFLIFFDTFLFFFDTPLITRPIFIFESFQFPFSWLHSDVSQSVRDIVDTVGSGSLVCWLHPHVWSFLLVLTRPLPVDSVAVHILNRGFSAKKAFLLVSSRPTRMAAFCRSLRQGLRGSEKWRAFIEDSPSYKPPYLWDIPLFDYRRVSWVCWVRWGRRWKCHCFYIPSLHGKIAVIRALITGCIYIIIYILCVWAFHLWIICSIWIHLTGNACQKTCLSPSHLTAKMIHVYSRLSRCFTIIFHGHFPWLCQFTRW
jgi:hypothetical protein